MGRHQLHHIPDARVQAARAARQRYYERLVESFNFSELSFLPVNANTHIIETGKTYRRR
jgi:hypothetical protein